MPGYKFHDATADPNKIKYLEYRKGIIAPDFIKSGYINSLEDYEDFFKDCDLSQIPSYKELLKTKNDSHFMNSNKRTDNPNISAFLSSKFVSINKLFWQGYLTHLIGDKYFYNSNVFNKSKFNKEFLKNKEKAIKDLHNDWNITNKIIDDIFKIELLDEVKKLDLVKFSVGKTKYVDKQSLISSIYEIRRICNCFIEGRN